MSRGIHKTIKNIFGFSSKNNLSKMVNQEGPDYKEIVKRWNCKIEKLESKKQKKYFKKNRENSD